MAMEKLSLRDQKIIVQCMSAVSLLIDEWETHSRLGISRDRLQTLIAEWPNLDDRIEDSDEFLAVNNCLNEVCNGLSIDEWFNLVDASPDEVREAYKNWLALQNTRGGIR